MILLAGGAVEGLPDGTAVLVEGDRIGAVAPACTLGRAHIDTAGAVLRPGRIDPALDLDLPAEPADAALAAIETLCRLRLDGLAGARVHGPAAVLAPVVAAQGRLPLPRLRCAGLTLRFGGGRVRVLGLHDGARLLDADDPLVALLADLPRLEAIEGDPPADLARDGLLLRDIADPAAFCGFTDVGRIAVGCRADLAVTEPDGRVRLRLVAGRIVA